MVINTQLATYLPTQNVMQLHQTLIHSWQHTSPHRTLCSYTKH